jgi:hypothetical protein
MDNGFETKDIIRSNPQCYNRVRFDTVLVQTLDGYTPARLRLVFEVNAYNRTWQLALVTYFSRVPTRAMDRTVGMARYEEQEQGEFIQLGSIIRSCYLTPIFSTPREFYLNNLVAGCTDLYLRCALS